MRRGFSVLDNPAHEGQSNTWLTPLAIVRALGHFDLDPCAWPGHKTAAKLICEPDDGLTAEWKGRVWLNPPYGRNIGPWLHRLQLHGNGIALVFSRTDTEWFHSLQPDCVFLIKGRIRFLRPNFTEGSNAGHGSMLLGWGQNNVAAILKSNLMGRMLT